MKESTAFSPGHITGLFQIFEAVNPLLKGSRGAGIAITRGVSTKICIKNAIKTSFKIRINGNSKVSAEVSKHVLQNLLPFIDGNYHILVDHQINIPIGAGFGSSGAGALSLALAFNEVFKLGLSYSKAAQFAHIAEVQCKTGLGSVIAETFGGVEIRKKPGAPGIGVMSHIPIDDNHVVICLKFAPTSTKLALTNEFLRQQINNLGGKLIDKLIVYPEPVNLMNFSRIFAEGVGLISNRVRKVLVEADKKGFICSMPMFGESVFSLVKRESLNCIKKIFSRHALSKDCIIISEIDKEGARIM